MRSIHEHSFSQIPGMNYPRARFDRSFKHMTTFDGDYIIPIMVEDILPGDTVDIELTAFCRLATPLYPLMNEAYLDVFWFFVPNRLVWTNFQRMMGERDPDPDSTINYSIPYTTINNAAELSLWDYFGIPTKVAQNKEISALPPRGYRLIYNYHFRDQDLQDSATTSIGDGPDTATDIDDIFVRGKRHDMFTSCRPNPQKGSTAVSLPLGTTAPVYGDGYSMTITDGTTPRGLGSQGSGYLIADTGNLDAAVGGAGSTGASPITKVLGLTTSPDESHIYTDLSAATAATINDFRLAVLTQQVLEMDARAGTRYPELILSHFGVESDDARQQRPEYLGGGSNRLNITPVVQQARDAGDDMGSLAALGTINVNNNRIVKSFTEHGYLFCLVNVRADLTYTQGLRRHWTKSTRYDFYLPIFANLGEQAVRNDEIYMQGTAADEQTFGYIPRWSEYRYRPSEITGLLRPNATASLEAWHLSEEFGSLPTLGDTFIKSTTPWDRAIATPSEPHFILDGYFSFYHTRVMPAHSIPGQIRF